MRRTAHIRAVVQAEETRIGHGQAMGVRDPLGHDHRMAVATGPGRGAADRRRPLVFRMVLPVIGSYGEGDAVDGGG